MSIGSVQDKQKEIAFFDAHASSDEYDVFTPEASARLISAFVRLTRLPRGARVADLGCGSGVFTELLRRAGYASVGLDEAIIDYVCEIPGSLKIGRYMPGTQIPVVDEAQLYTEQPDYAVIFSWHIADELAPKLKAKGFRGELITPLPVPRVVQAAS